MSTIRIGAIGVLPLVLLLAFQSTILSFFKSSTADINRSSVSVVFSATSHFSHVEKIVPFAEDIAKLGYDVHFVAAKEFENIADSSLVKFQALDGPPGMVSDEVMQKFVAMPPEEGMMYLPVQLFVGRIPDMESTLQRLFGRLTDTKSDIVLIHDISMLGLLPQQLGKKGILPKVSMALGIAPIAIDSNDTYPFNSVQLPDTTPNRRAIHHQANLAAREVGEGLAFGTALTETLSELGVPRPHNGFWNSMGALDDYLLQIGIPEFEYERSDLAPKLVHLGAPDKVGGARTLPPWWDDIAAAKKAGKHIVVVSQGSAFPDLKAILVPTLKALADRDDMLVIGTTVVIEPEELPDFEAPANARLAKYVPFDLLLPEASLLVCAGGYGTVIQAIAAGVPMVHAGVLQDKSHTGLLAEYKGISVNLKTGTPTTEQLVNGVNTILGDNASQEPDLSYLRRVQAMSIAIKKYHPVQRMDEAIQSGLKMADAKR